MSARVPHEPVLLTAVQRWLALPSGGAAIDATVGPGGHAEALLRAVGPSGRVLGIDRDPEALAWVRRRLAGQAGFIALQGDHGEIGRLARAAGFGEVDGILFDLGVSSLQLDSPARGFSLRADGPLDMRMDPTSGTTAAELLAGATEAELREILEVYGEERRAAALARAIVRERMRHPLGTTRQLVELVEAVLGPQARRYRIPPATRTFQALRIAVNREIRELEATITEATTLLRRGGRIVVLSYHSLEDRAVKSALRGLSARCVCPPRLPVCVCGTPGTVRVLTARAVRPSTVELDRNPRARSARLRAAEKL